MLIPHFIFPGLIEKTSMNSTSKIPIRQFFYNEISEYSIKLNAIVQQISEKEQVQEIHCWFIIDEMINAKLLPDINSYLQEEIMNSLNHKLHVQIHIIPGTKESPLEEMMIDFEPNIHELSISHPFANFGHVVAFGDAIPEEAFFLEGIRQWEDRYVSIYTSDSDISIVRTTIKGKTEQWTKQFRQFILDHDYYAALLMVEDLPQSDLSKGLKNVLHMMVDRFNYAFDDAILHLQDAKKYLGEHRLFKETETIFERLRSTNEQEKDLALIVELYRQLDVYFDLDELPAFLIRFYRAREAVMHYLYNYAQTNQDKYRVASKSSFHKVIDEMEEKYDLWELDGYYGAYFYIKSQNVADTLKLRNNSFIGHGRTGINELKLWKEYSGYIGTTKEKAKRRFVVDTSLLLRDLGVHQDENITKLNRYLLRTVVKGILPNEAFINSSI
jgi:flagellar biosynthesis protein FliP